MPAETSSKSSGLRSDAIIVIQAPPHPSSSAMALATAAASFAFPCFWVSLDEIVTGVMEHIPPPPFFF